jgi:hypothetical protein
MIDGRGTTKARNDERVPRMIREFRVVNSATSTVNLPPEP